MTYGVILGRRKVSLVSGYDTVMGWCADIDKIQSMLPNVEIVEIFKFNEQKDAISFEKKLMVEIIKLKYRKLSSYYNIPFNECIKLANKLYININSDLLEALL